MDSPILLRQLLRSPSTYLPFLTPSLRPQLQSHFLTFNRRTLSTDSLPRIAQPSLWKSLIPKPLRRNPEDPASQQTSKKRKGWNPATPYIVLALLVGSQAIQTLWLKRDVAHFSSRADAHIGLLREVVERVQRGEDVDVERVLGTGDPGKEAEWEEGKLFSHFPNSAITQCNG